MATHKYVYHHGYLRIIEETDTHYITIPIDRERLHIPKTPDTDIITRNYLPIGTKVIYRYSNKLGTICAVDINDCEVPYLVSFDTKAANKKYCAYYNIREIDY